MKRADLVIFVIHGDGGDDSQRIGIDQKLQCALTEGLSLLITEKLEILNG